MIGNDVIDLNQTRQESNWQRKGFMHKLFTDEEQLLIANNPDSETLVWLLWSMKEAAYKIYNRQTKIREYIPKTLECILLTKDRVYATGIVHCFDMIYHTKTTLSKEEIHTVAVTSLSDLDRIIEIEKKGIIKDENGIPYLLSNGQAVSISNHGRFEKVVTIETNKN